MSYSAKTIFISDLHLEEEAKESSLLFLKLLNACSEKIDSLYILGDLFEAWIGDDYVTPFHREIILALKTVTKSGIPIYFIPGNRDFLIGEEFLRETGCRLLADEEKISLYGTPVLIMHGDTLCTKDANYQKWRKLRNIHWLKKLFLYLPLKWRIGIATKMRAESKKHTSKLPMYIMDVDQQAVIKTINTHGVNYLIHGHTHQPNIHSFFIEEMLIERIVLGAWHESAKILVWDQNGKKELVTISLNENNISQIFI